MRTAADERGGGGRRKKRGRERKKRHRACFAGGVCLSRTVGIRPSKPFFSGLLEERAGERKRQRADVLAGLCFQSEIDPSIQHNVAACVGAIAGKPGRLCAVNVYISPMLFLHVLHFRVRANKQAHKPVSFSTPQISIECTQSDTVLHVFATL